MEKRNVLETDYRARRKLRRMITGIFRGIKIGMTSIKQV